MPFSAAPLPPKKPSIAPRARSISASFRAAARSKTLSPGAAYGSIDIKPSVS